MAEQLEIVSKELVGAQPYRTGSFRVLSYQPATERDVGDTVHAGTRAAPLDPIWWMLKLEVYPVTTADEGNLVRAVGTDVSILMETLEELDDEVQWPGDTILTWPGDVELGWPGVVDSEPLADTNYFVLWGELLDGVLVDAQPAFVGGDRAQGFRWRLEAEVIRVE